MNEVEILRAYITGVVSRGTAMKQLGLDWYGELLVLLSKHGIARPEVSGADAATMDAALRKAIDD